MSEIAERLRHVTDNDGTVHIAFPTALLTLCGRSNETLPKTVLACACKPCLANMRSLVKVAPSVEPRGLAKAA